MLIRNATLDDAVAACEVLRVSVSELCAADHGNDPMILGRWLGNKTPENLAAWTQHASHSLLVAIEGKSIVAVGSVRDSGNITLNYVAPSARFQGVSTFLLAALETRAAERGNARAALFSAPRRPTASISHVATAMTARRSNTSARGGYPMSRLIGEAE